MALSAYSVPLPAVRACLKLLGAESKNVPVGIHMSALVLAPFSVLRYVNLGSGHSPLFRKAVGIVNVAVDRVPTAGREEVLGNPEVDLDAVTCRESVTHVQMLPGRKSKSLVVIKRCIEVADGKDRGHSPYGCHTGEGYKIPSGPLPSLP
jgi:hypothetical protein